MNLIDLANNLTLRLVAVQHQFSPRRWFAFQIVAYPTVGKTFQDTLDLMRNWSFQWHEDNGAEDIAVLDAMLGEGAEATVSALLAQWVAYQASQPYAVQLKGLFDYIVQVGVAP